MGKIILAIHGLGNKPPNELLTQWWEKSIIEGLNNIDRSFKRIPLEMVYWADILHPEPLDLNTQDPEDPLFLAEPYLASSGSSKTGKEKLLTKLFNYFEQQLDRLFLNPDMSLNFEKVTDHIIHKYFADLETYYMASPDNSEQAEIPTRNLIRTRLQMALKKHRYKEIMLLSHSMGTIISYDVLNNLKEPNYINTFVTIGSPLGLPIIVSRIFSEQKEIYKKDSVLKTPGSVHKKWVNISDKEDMVALDHTLNDDFEANEFGIRAEDFFVYNDYEINGERNAHKIYGYLRTPEVVNAIAEFLDAPSPLWIVKIFKRFWFHLKNRFSGKS